MRTLLILLSYEKANPIVARHWEFYKRAACDIMCVGREDSNCVFPEDKDVVWRVNIGKDSYVNGHNLPDMHIKALSCGLSIGYNADSENPQPYTHFCLTEVDAIFLKPLPLHLGGLMATYGGGKSQGFYGNAFFHGPWVVDRTTAQKFVDGGRAMLNCGLFELGFPDRFWGLWQELYGIKFTPMGRHSYSQNRLDRPEFIQQAREAITGGACYVHGIKTAEELELVTR